MKYSGLFLVGTFTECKICRINFYLKLYVSAKLDIQEVIEYFFPLFLPKTYNISGAYDLLLVLLESSSGQPFFLFLLFFLGGGGVTLQVILQVLKKIKYNIQVHEYFIYPRIILNAVQQQTHGNAKDCFMMSVT